MPKPVIPRHRAQQDTEEAINRYVHEAGVEVAIGFVDSLEEAYRLLSSHPAAGSPHYAHELRIADLRHLRLQRYPYLVFYIERSDCVDVWRILHDRHDIPAWVRQTDPIAQGSE
ncbi:type II toxin-antitoxin system RelE/ParE family toxin [Roseibium salinum]|uniref:Type II toxin-antitoxin system RelE/ParE family toxin n=1 Tax=Roseibium salinum TaxID=1604349 RepID=A0ABT3QXN7_9HYPH|nr:type II toxin-antitoxin system RelE/ParE family toxin [Roseibium sp. DSM 29163]MCX2721613.1 type II toxin-antitoxin system RelE/ParE family toxin [Roseibium sp. DSM 29163]MDN3722081.1 type II toxin-antitoxin system RelE/ParE family toxin [Roseibium salinum]